MKKKDSSKVNKVKTDVIQESATDELRKLSTILITIVGIICVFYIITAIVTKKNQSLKYVKDETISQISYTDILASDILRKEGSYYVLVKNPSDVYLPLFETYISAYSRVDNHLRIYSVDLNDALNQSYKADKNHFEADQLQFQDTTLLRISDGSIEAVYETSDSIDEHLKSLLSV